MVQPETRRRFVRGTAIAMAVGLAGCGQPAEEEETDDDDGIGAEETGTEDGFGMETETDGELGALGEE